MEFVKKEKNVTVALLRFVDLVFTFNICFHFSNVFACYLLREIIIVIKTEIKENISQT